MFQALLFLPRLYDQVIILLCFIVEYGNKSGAINIACEIKLNFMNCSILPIIKKTPPAVNYTIYLRPTLYILT